jgi:toxin ParE1/3/4
MPASGLEIHPDALDEADAGVNWYLERSERTAVHFADEVDRAIELILEAPERWPVFRRGARRYVMRTFPYSIIYTIREGAVIVYAFAHARKRPGYWMTRLP